MNRDNDKYVPSLLELIQRDEIRQTTTILLNERGKIGGTNNDWKNQITLLSARYETLRKNQQNGTISNENENVELNKIRDSLIQVITENDLDDWGSLDRIRKRELEYLANLGEDELFKEIESRFQTLFRQIEDLEKQLHSPTPPYHWAAEFSVKMDTIRTKWNTRRFQIAVMALVKAGKSTFLNSLIGNEFLPSASVAETMRLIRIRHKPERLTGVLLENGKEVARGVDDIRKYIRLENQRSRNITREERESELLLETNLTTLKDRELSRYEFDILDTPGVNEAGIASLQAKVEQIAKTSDVIIYLLDYTKLKTKDEEGMLSSLKGWRKELFKHLRLRLFFVVNKVDAANRHDREKNMTPGEVKSYVVRIIKEATDISVEEEDIILISAERALLSHLVRSNSMSKEQLQDFDRIAFGEMGPEKDNQAQYERAVSKLLDNSGFTELEEKVLRVIHRKRSEILLSSTLDDLNNAFEQTERDLTVTRGTLLTDIDTVKKLQKRIEEIQAEIQRLAQDTTAFKKKADAVVDGRFKEFRKEVTNQIIQAFRGSQKAKATTYSWFRPVTDFWDRTQYEIRSQNPAETRRWINELNRGVVEVLEQRLNLVWNNISEDLFLAYRDVCQKVERQTQPIIRRIEEAINEALDVDLKPANLSIEALSLDQFYYQTTDKLNEIIKRENHSSLNWFERILNPILALFGLEKEEVKWNEYSVRSKDYANFLEKATNDLIEEAQELAYSSLTESYLKQVEFLLQKLHLYGQRYIEITQVELKQRAEVAKDTPNRLALIEDHLENVKTLELQLSGLREVVNLIV
ncbi:MAG: dynamin family protein [Bacteroidia bacterium]